MSEQEQQLPCPFCGAPIVFEPVDIPTEVSCDICKRSLLFVPKRFNDQPTVLSKQHTEGQARGRRSRNRSGYTASEQNMLAHIADMLHMVDDYVAILLAAYHQTPQVDISHAILYLEGQRAALDLLNGRLTGRAQGEPMPPTVASGFSPIKAGGEAREDFGQQMENERANRISSLLQIFQLPS